MTVRHWLGIRHRDTEKKRSFLLSASLCRTLPAWAAGAALIFGGSGRADTVKLAKGLVYDRVTIITVADGVISFRTATGSEVSKPLSEVGLLELTGQEQFNAAEKLLGERKAKDAVAAYAGILKAGPTGWQKPLARYRLLAALNAAGQIDQAAQSWLEFCDESASAANLSLRPTTLAPADSPANDKAIALLADKAGKLETNKSPTRQSRYGDGAPYLRQVQLLMVDLYERQGKLEQAQALAAALAGKPANVPATAGIRQPGPPVAPSGSASDQLRLAGLSIRNGQFAEAIGMLEPRLASLAAPDLPRALLLLGQAQAGQAGKETDKQAAGKLLLSAGLNLMKVVSAYPASEQAPPALLTAAQVNQRLGNDSAARAAYEGVVKLYARSESAKAASAALEAMKKPK